jgi:PQ loop repeat
MIMSEATWLAFAVFSGLRTVSYVPQIVRIAKDRNGASAISYPTWMLWTCANASTAAYAAVNLADLWLAVVSSVFALCCIVVIGLTAVKRLLHRRAACEGGTKSPSGRSTSPTSLSFKCSPLQH